MILTFDQKIALGEFLNAKEIEAIEQDKVRLVDALPTDLYEAFMLTIWDSDDLYEDFICFYCEREEPIRGDGTCSYCGEDGNLVERIFDYNGNMYDPETYEYIKPMKVQ